MYKTRIIKSIKISVWPLHPYVQNAQGHAKRSVYVIRFTLLALSNLASSYHNILLVNSRAMFIRASKPISSVFRKLSARWLRSAIRIAGSNHRANLTVTQIRHPQAFRIHSQTRRILLYDNPFLKVTHKTLLYAPVLTSMPSFMIIHHQRHTTLYHLGTTYHHAFIYDNPSSKAHYTITDLPTYHHTFVYDNPASRAHNTLL